MIIDAHHHLWHYDTVEYGWIDDGMAAIRRDFLPEDLAAEFAAVGVEGAVTVQARQTVEETRWLLELAGRYPLLRGVVGWLPLADSKVESALEEFAANPKLRGVRHVLQGEPDAYMQRDDFNRGVALLARYKLRYDLLIYERQLPAAIEFVDHHPELPIVLDHIAKPRIREAQLEPWRRFMRDLAKRPHVFCKLSGMVTEADWRQWTPEGLQPFAEVALEAFGPRRLMFGSDWPVCLVAADYSRWLDLVRRWIAPLAPAERQQILADNAISFYGLSD